MTRLSAFFVFVTLILSEPSSGEEIRLPGLEASVDVLVDAHGIPHLYAQSWSDAYRALGVLHVENRLAQMEFYRRLGAGRLAEIVGPDVVPSDKLVRQLGIRRSCEEFWKSTSVPSEMRAEFEAYAEGVSAAIQGAGEERLAPLVKALGVKPGEWSPIDSLVFMKYMGWDQSGTSDDLWLTAVLDKLGPDASEELWPLERPYEIPAVEQQFDRRQWKPIASKNGEWDRTRAFALGNREGDIGPAARSVASMLDSARILPRASSFGSNNWAVDGTKTRSGKPILCSDPHLGFTLPAIWYTCHLSVKGQNVAGVTFPGSPIVVIGYNDFCGWGITNMQADAVDYFAETVKEDDPRQYKHRGKWKKMTIRKETIAVRGGPPVEFEIEETVHGPVMSRDGKVISMQWTGLGPTTDAVGLYQSNRAKNIREWLSAIDLVQVPALNLVYADVEGNIAMHPMGRLPIRARGQGRTVLDGASGNHDWVRDIPRAELPLAVNPESHYVASANGRPHPLGYPHYVGWMWDPSYRVRRIGEMLQQADDLTIESMASIQNDAHDYAAERFLPILLDVLKKSPPTDSFERAVAQMLANWDYVASRESQAPLIWQRWFEIYRQQVWADDWKVKGIEPQGGSWGFNGSNKREPMIEVLEYLHREYPDSPWFDDKATPTIETRDDILQRSFSVVVSELRKRHGDDLSAYAWKNFNITRVRSLFGDDSLARTGGSIVGDDWTVNPAGDGGPVGGGACWRMIVDFGHPDQSVGVYPGGQSGDPSSPIYADQLPIWEKGEYLPLQMTSRESLKKVDGFTSRRFAPASP